MLKTINAHPRDLLITFDSEPHLYYYNKSKVFHSSVTTFVKEHFPKFDSKKNDVVDNIVKKNFENVKSKYYKMNAQQIKDLWSKEGLEAANAGTKLHYNIEQFYNESHVNEDITKTKEWDFFQNFVKANKHLSAYRTEWEVYDTEIDLAGSIDMIFKDNEGKYHIYDWKRSKEIKFSAFNNETGYQPLTHIQNSNYWHYALQLSIYKYILEKHYNINIETMHIVVFHPNFENYMDYHLPDLSCDVETLVESRKRIFLQMQQEQSGL